MKNTTYEIGCNPVLASTEISNEDKIAILQQKVAQYDYTGCGLTMADNIDIVSGWDCTTQDTVVNALAGKVYFSEPKIHPGSPFTSYFSAPLWKDGIAYAPIEGTDGWSVAISVSQSDYRCCSEQLCNGARVFRNL